MKNLFIIILVSIFITNLVYCNTNNTDNYDYKLMEKIDEELFGTSKYIMGKMSPDKLKEAKANGDIIIMGLTLIAISPYGIVKKQDKTFDDYKIKNEAKAGKVEAAKQEAIYWTKKILKPKFIHVNLESKLIPLDDFPHPMIYNPSRDYIISKYNIDNYEICIADACRLSVRIYKPEEEKINNITNYIKNQLEYFFNFSTNDLEKYDIIIDENVNGLYAGHLSRENDEKDTKEYDIRDWKTRPLFVIKNNFVCFVFQKGENAKIMRVGSPSLLHRF